MTREETHPYDTVHDFHVEPSSTNFQTQLAEKSRIPQYLRS